MQFSISDTSASLYISGIITILALIAVGGILTLVLRKMATRYPFSRLALVLSLSPFSLIGFLDRGANSSLYLYAMIVILLGITIDGIAYLLKMTISNKVETQEVIALEKPAEAVSEKPEESGVIIWEKAE